MSCIAVWATMKLAKANFYGNQHRIEVGEGSGNQSGDYSSRCSGILEGALDVARYIENMDLNPNPSQENLQAMTSIWDLGYEEANQIAN